MLCAVTTVVAAPGFAELYPELTTFVFGLFDAVLVNFTEEVTGPETLLVVADPLTAGCEKDEELKRLLMLLSYWVVEFSVVMSNENVELTSLVVTDGLVVLSSVMAGSVVVDRPVVFRSIADVWPETPNVVDTVDITL